MVPFESINHQRKIEDAFQSGYDIAEILFEKTESVDVKDKLDKVAYTIRLDKKIQSYQMHRTGYPSKFRRIERNDLVEDLKKLTINIKLNSLNTFIHECESLEELKSDEEFL
jgi:hypothetical protein